MAVGLTAYAIGYKRLKRLIIGFSIGALIYSILHITVLYSLPFTASLVLAFILVVIALAIAHIIHEDRSGSG